MKKLLRLGRLWGQPLNLPRLQHTQAPHTHAHTHTQSAHTHTHTHTHTQTCSLDVAQAYLAAHTRTPDTPTRAALFPTRAHWTWRRRDLPGSTHTHIPPPHTHTRTSLFPRRALWTRSGRGARATGRRSWRRSARARPRWTPSSSARCSSCASTTASWRTGCASPRRRRPRADLPRPRPVRPAHPLAQELTCPAHPQSTPPTPSPGADLPRPPPAQDLTCPAHPKSSPLTPSPGADLSTHGPPIQPAPTPPQNLKFSLTQPFLRAPTLCQSYDVTPTCVSRPSCHTQVPTDPPKPTCTRPVKKRKEMSHVKRRLVQSRVSVLSRGSWQRARPATDSW